MFYPELGKWVLRGSGQDFQVHATGASVLTRVFNFLTTDIGHFWMVIAGAGWLCSVLLVPPGKRRNSSQHLTAIQTTPPSQSPPARAVAPMTEEPVNPFTPRKPLWTNVYDRDKEHPWISETPEPRRYSFEEHSTAAAALTARFSTSKYVRELKARLTFYDDQGKENAAVQGCWLESPYYNAASLTAGDIGGVVIVLCGDVGGKPEYAIVNDKRHQYTKPYAPIEYVPCAVTDGWRVKVELFIGKQIGPEHVFECFTGANGRIQVRNIQTKDTSE
jgi:hypothetical protein